MSDPYVTTTSSTLSPIEYWRREVLVITREAQSIVKRIEEARRIYRANGIADIIAMADPAVALPGTTMSAAHATALAATVDAVAAFMNTPINPDDPADSTTVQDVLYRVWEPGTVDTP